MCSIILIPMAFKPVIMEDVLKYKLHVWASVETETIPHKQAGFIFDIRMQIFNSE